MSSPFLGQLQPMPLNFAPRGWALCNGQILPISQFTALFSLLGTFYGGNGTSNFALPDLRSRVPVHSGQGPGLSQRDIGEQGGEETVTLITSTMPSHNHSFFGTTSAANSKQPEAGAALATTLKPPSTSPGDSYYSAAGAGNTQINVGALSPFLGSGSPHANIQPYLAITWCIALQGIFPARN